MRSIMSPFSRQPSSEMPSAAASLRKFLTLHPAREIGSTNGVAVAGLGSMDDVPVACVVPVAGLGSMDGAAVAGLGSDGGASLDCPCASPLVTKRSETISRRIRSSFSRQPLMLTPLRIITAFSSRTVIALSCSCDKGDDGCEDARAADAREPRGEPMVSVANSDRKPVTELEGAVDNASGTRAAPIDGDEALAGEFGASSDAAAGINSKRPDVARRSISSPFSKQSLVSTPKCSASRLSSKAVLTLRSAKRMRGLLLAMRVRRPRSNSRLSVASS
mmetsp:Transcript_3890/g.9914  ORF Transcript_3890/g.9914 Transcript_3890/m.9914 type:complete len:276 (+) Transcript_3890:705-1532(+)